jgi:hypothetical protein
VNGDDLARDGDSAAQAARSQDPKTRTAHGAFAWLQLIRLPNLFTVPGDPLAGFFLAGAAVAQAGHDSHAPLWRGLSAGAASLLLYAAGLIQNDLRDRKEDSRDRPERPLPSGRIGLWPARAACAALAAGGLALAGMASWTALAVGAALLAAICLYNCAIKKSPVAGPATMGVCRGLSLLLGASACLAETPGQPSILSAAGGLALYIAAVTLIAGGETGSRPIGAARFMPSCVAIAWLCAVEILVRPPPAAPAIASVALAVLAAAWAARAGLALSGEPRPARVQRAIGVWIRCLLPLQAAMAAIGPWPGLAVAACLLAAWPAAGVVSRWFYAS